MDDKTSFTFRYAGQINQRKEYDVRRSGRSEIPALDMTLHSQLVETILNTSLDNGIELKTGIQANYKFNFNDNANTGVLPLIPQYQLYQSGVFGIITQKFNTITWEGGLRYDYIYLKAVPITVQPDGSKIIEHINTPFQNIAGNGGLHIQLKPDLAATFSLGYAQRSPEVNELYSYGLHQGVSGIENGNRNLKKERSLKSLFSMEWSPGKAVSLQATGYYQHINDYIYLEPQNEFEETVRGAFPVFLYTQTDALIYGTDINLSVNPGSFMKMNFGKAGIK